MDNYQRVLIVEDDNFLGELLVDYLNKNGVKAALYRDAESALKSIRLERPSLILLDLLLPGMDGLTFLETLKNEGFIPEIPAIILSNMTQNENVERGLSLGARDFLVKSHFELTKILEKIRSMLGDQQPAPEETPK